ncbi:MAG: hypothetical protein ACE5HN_02275 [Nitrospiria bacterium]
MKNENFFLNLLLPVFCFMMIAIMAGCADESDLPTPALPVTIPPLNVGPTPNTVESPASNVGVDPSLAIGSDGFARISYYDVTISNVGASPSVVIGADGFARVSYYDATKGDLRFARCTDADCTNRVITSVDGTRDTGDVGSNSSLANGPDGFPRISYYDATNGDLKFARCTDADCTTPVITTVDSTGDVGSNSSLANGGSGFAGISYYDATNGDLKFARCTDADCTNRMITTVDGVVDDIGSNSSLAIGIDGKARISYYDATNGNLKFARCKDTNCMTPKPDITVVDFTNDVGSNSSIAIGADGFARISYYDATNGDLEFARCADVDCKTPVSLAVDSTGDVGNLKFVRCADSDCTTPVITTVDSTGDVGSNSSLAIWTNGAGSDGLARISFYDTTNGDLRFARCADVDCANRVITIVDATGDVGVNSSLAIGIDGFARISYNDVTNGNLKFALCADADCTTSTITTVNPVGDVGANSSLAMDTDGFAGIGYWNILAQQLKFVRCHDAACTAPTITTVDNTVDPDGIVGSGSSIAIDADGFARMSYYGEGMLKFAGCTDADCTTPVITPVTQAIFGIRTSLAIGSGGVPRIAYFDGPNGVLNFVRCTDVACTAPTIKTVDSALIVGEFPSLAIGADGFARIAYYRRTTGDLRFARCSDADCTAVSIATVDR